MNRERNIEKKKINKMIQIYNLNLISRESLQLKTVESYFQLKYKNIINHYKRNKYQQKRDLNKLLIVDLRKYILEDKLYK